MVALLPGSRGDELAALTQVLLDAASRACRPRSGASIRGRERCRDVAAAGGRRSARNRGQDACQRRQPRRDSQRRSRAHRIGDRLTRSGAPWRADGHRLQAVDDHEPCGARGDPARIDRGVCRRPAEPAAPPHRGARGAAGACASRRSWRTRHGPACRIPSVCDGCKRTWRRLPACCPVRSRSCRWPTWSADARRRTRRLSPTLAGRADAGREHGGTRLMSDRRVVVTGIGAITPLGPTLAATLAALAADRSAIAPASIFDASGFACTDSAEIRDWDPRPSFRVPKALKLTDRPARFAVAAARMALVDARWDVDDDMRQESLAVVIGSSGSDLQARDLAHAMGDDPSGETANDVAGVRRPDSQSSESALAARQPAQHDERARGDSSCRRAGRTARS